MCGIFFFLADSTTTSPTDDAAIAEASSRLAHRGPDGSRTLVVGRATLGFHRLAIFGDDAGGRELDRVQKGMQPMRLDEEGDARWVLLCNGEVYNQAFLARAYAAKESASELQSDVEVILWMLEEHDMDVASVAARLDGDFAFVALDSATSEFVAARDPVGVRPLFYGLDGEGKSVVAFASEAKALVGLEGIAEVRVFPPGHAYSSKTGRFEPYVADAVAAAAAAYAQQQDAHDWTTQGDDGEAIRMADLIPRSGPFGGSSDVSSDEKAAAAAAVRAELDRAVEKRIEHGDVSDVVGVLCSGGVDSAAITGLAHHLMSSDDEKKNDKRKKAMRVFTMRYSEGRSDDAFYAGLLCEHLGVDHRTFEFGPEDLGDDTIAAVVRACETCDPNTIRAAIPMYLLAKAIRGQAPEVKVVLSGEGADELFGGYNYFRLAPDARAASAECDRLLKNLHMFDLLRADRCFAAHGLEVRVPFLDPALIARVRDVRVVSHERRVSGETQLLRDAVSDLDALARFRILDRPKEKFSDGAGYTYVPDLLRRIAGASEGGDDGTLETRLAAEKALYRKIFDREFGACATRDAWVVERELPKWKEVEARQGQQGGGGGLKAW